MTRGALIAWSVLLCVAFYVCYFSHLDVLGFIGPDEPRYAWIARAMVETHDWVTPRLYGRPWFERSEEHTSEPQSRLHLVCRLLLEKKKNEVVIVHTSTHNL